MSAFDDAEASVQDSEPRELIEISINDGVTVYRHTSAGHDITYGGNRYTALALERGEISVMTPGDNENDLTLTLPIDHPFVRRYLAQGLPPKRVSIRVIRTQGAHAETIWIGNVTSLACKGPVASFRVPSRPGGWMLRAIPSATISKLCPHILYSESCGVDREGSHDGLAFKVVTTVLYVNGRVIRVDLQDTDRNLAWSVFGEVLHVPSGERMSVWVQADLSPGASSVADLTMQHQIVGLKVGDTVHVFAGCDRTIHGFDGCTNRFGNRQNFGGMPRLPDKNVFVPGSYGPKVLT